MADVVARDKRACVFMCVSVNWIDTADCAKLLEGLSFGRWDNFHKYCYKLSCELNDKIVISLFRVVSEYTHDLYGTLQCTMKSENNLFMVKQD